MHIVARSLARRPGFALATIALIGLGIGATTMIFSIVDSVLLRPLPYPASQRLLLLQKAASHVPVPDFVDLRAQAKSFDGVGAVMRSSMDPRTTPTRGASVTERSTPGTPRV